MSPCECGSTRDYFDCCGPYIEGYESPPTAETLMRSRYTAYARGEPQGIEWLVRTHDPKTRTATLAEDVAAWARVARFTRLDVRRVEQGTTSDGEGFVTFVAYYEEGGRGHSLSERSRFRRDEAGHWLYVDGAAPGPARSRTG